MGYSLLNLPHTYLCQEEGLLLGCLGPYPHMCEQMLIFKRENKQRGVFIQGGYLVSIRKGKRMRFSKQLFTSLTYFFIKKLSKMST